MRRATWWALLACGALIGCDGPANDGLDVGKSPAGTKAEPGGAEKVPTAEPASTPDATPAPAPGEAKAPDAEKTSVLTPEEIENLKKLPEADAKMALAQQICPVSDEHLGAEGMEPIKVTADGKTVMLCCEGCKESFDKEPAKFLAKAAAPK